MLTTPMAGSCDSSTKTQTEYLCTTALRLCLVPRPDTKTNIFCFLSDFRIKQVLNLQFPLFITTFPLFITTDRCYGKCSGVGRVQQVAKGVCVCFHLFHSVYWAYQPGMVANSARGQLNRENRLRTRNRES